MRIWVDAQLSPALARWLSLNFAVEAAAVRDIGLRDAEDLDIFLAAREAQAMVMTKDRDFVDLLDRMGPPPPVIWITCGNTSNQILNEILRSALPAAIEMLEGGESLVEISDARS